MYAAICDYAVTCWDRGIHTNIGKLNQTSNHQIEIKLSRMPTSCAKEASQCRYEYAP